MNTTYYRRDTAPIYRPGELSPSAVYVIEFVIDGVLFRRTFLLRNHRLALALFNEHPKATWLYISDGEKIEIIAIANAKGEPVPAASQALLRWVVGALLAVIPVGLAGLALLLMRGGK